MTQGCVDFALGEAKCEDTIAPPATYVLEISYDVFDPKAFDQFAGGVVFEGKSVDAGSWKVRSNNLDYLMTYAEVLALTWKSDRLLSPGERYVQGVFEIRRQGMPLLLLNNYRWAAIGDDYMDPWEEEATSETQMMVIPDETHPADMDVNTDVYDAPFFSYPAGSPHDVMNSIQRAWREGT